MITDIKKYLDCCTESERIELTIYNNAQINTAKEYQNTPTSQHKRDWDAARDGFELIIERLNKKYFPKEKQYTTGEKTFTSVIELEKYLREIGFKTSKSKIARDAKKGLLSKIDGFYHEADVKTYAATLDILHNATDETIAALAVHTKEKELILLEIKIERAKHEMADLQKKYVPRADFYRELAERSALLVTGLRHFFRSRAAEIISLVGGDTANEEHLFNYLNDNLSDLMNEYANIKRFQITIMADSDPNSAELN